MHFVKKEPTSEEERIVKEKERTIKINKFLNVRNKIFLKKRKDEYDDELLALTQGVLSKNPDISTFWNIRRTTINLMIDCSQAEERKSNAQKLLSADLGLTNECLMNANPKSYGAWYHRGWVIERMIATGNQPDFKSELLLCKKALDYDCRNFHCWDHRRIVSKLAKCSKEEEIEFSLDRINHNFSNYSAWHYRSVLLNPMQESSKKFEEPFLREELDRIAQAFCCDPEDQSAFVYAQWLLSLDSCKTSITDKRSKSFPLSITCDGKQSTIVWTRAVTTDAVLSIIQNVNADLLQPHSSLCAISKAAIVWTYTSDNPVKFRLKEEDDWFSVSETNPLVRKDLLQIIYDCDRQRPKSLVAELLIEKLEILRALPPVSSWTLYTYVLCLMEYDPHKNHQEILDILQELAEVKDTKRRELYEALISRQVLNHALSAEIDGKQLLCRILDGEEEVLNLKRRKITSLKGIEYLAGFLKNLNVADNFIENFDEMILPNLEYLDVSENPIKKITPTQHLRKLQSLNIASTSVKNVEDVLPGLLSLSRLNKFIFPETELVAKAALIADGLADKKHIRLINYWL